MCSAANSQQENEMSNEPSTNYRASEPDNRSRGGAVASFPLASARYVLLLLAPGDCRLALGICAADAWRWRLLWRWLWRWPGRGRRMPTSSSSASTTPAFACASPRILASQLSKLVAKAEIELELTVNCATFWNFVTVRALNTITFFFFESLLQAKMFKTSKKWEK